MRWGWGEYFLEYVDGGVHDTGVDVSELLESETAVRKVVARGR